MNAHDACFPGKDGHAPLSLYNGSIMMAGQAPIHDECAESLFLLSRDLLLRSVLPIYVFAAPKKGYLVYIYRALPFVVVHGTQNSLLIKKSYSAVPNSIPSRDELS